MDNSLPKNFNSPSKLEGVDALADRGVCENKGKIK